MKVLIVCARFPERDGKGDQVRARQQVELLAPAHAITVLTSGRPSSPAAREDIQQLATVRMIAPTRLERLLGAVGALTRGVPLQVGWMTPGRVSRAAARAAVEHDVVIASTIRCLPRPLPAATVLDHIDALSANMRQRTRLERRVTLRLAAWLEARLLAAHEARAARWVAAQIVISSVDAARLPPRPAPVVIPIALPESGHDDASERRDGGPGARDGGAGARDIDVIVTGNMRYPPNREAAEWLAGEIAPRLRRRRPRIRIVVAGRSAGDLALSGVEVASDVPDLSDLLRRARVAAVPLRSGTGAPIKVLEAAACGAAIVCTPWVARAVEVDLDTAVDADSFAQVIEGLLTDESKRRARAAAGLAGLSSRRPDAVRAALTDVLARAAARTGA